jgi:anthranilate phosphoribosyltransferase
MTVQEAIEAVVGGESLSADDTYGVFNEIMEGKATDAQIAALIVGLRMKGETIEEITGAARSMREKAVHVVPEDKTHLVDTCGTGGDGSNTFNVSTAAAFVAAGAGARVAKHGNRSVSSQCGSADVLESLGVTITVSPETMKECLDEIGICFLFAPLLHKAMKYAIGPRKEIGVRTVFNILGPLTNPAMASSQLLGVFSPDLVEPLASVLNNMGSSKAYVVHGTDPLDEISVSTETRVAELCGGKVTSYSVKPQDFGIEPSNLDLIKGRTAEENAHVIHNVLGGSKGPSRDIVVLNAAFAIAASGRAATPQEGIGLACESIDSGAAMAKLEKLVEKTRSASAA